MMLQMENSNIEIDTITKNLTEMLELKISMAQMKYSLEELNNRASKRKKNLKTCREINKDYQCEEQRKYNE